MFRCPPHFEKYRLAVNGARGDATHGLLDITDRDLRVQFSNSWGWEHVSVSHPDRMPSYQVMDVIRRAFWSDDCTVMHLHVPPDHHIDAHPFCLHLWRPTNDEIPRPPHYLVGPDAKQDKALNLPLAFIERHMPDLEDCFLGIPIDRFSREELMAIVGSMHSQLCEVRAQHTQHTQPLKVLAGGDD